MPHAVRVDPAEVGVQHVVGGDRGRLVGHVPGGENRENLVSQALYGNDSGGPTASTLTGRIRSSMREPVQSGPDVRMDSPIRFRRSLTRTCIPRPVYSDWILRSTSRTSSGVHGTRRRVRVGCVEDHTRAVVEVAGVRSRGRGSRAAGSGQRSDLESSPRAGGPVSSSGAQNSSSLAVVSKWRK